MSVKPLQTPGEIADRLAIMELKSNYAAGLDAQDWKLWRSLFTDEAVFDLSSFTGIPPRPIEADRVVAGTARLFAQLDGTQHVVTSHRVEVRGDEAKCRSHVRAYHWKGEDCFTMIGYYDDRMVRTADGWRIREMQLKITRTEGDRRVWDEATERSRATS